ncbi:MAG: hypothetical protein U0235_05170 [Polyangiaceae bacterium]
MKTISAFALAPLAVALLTTADRAAAADASAPPLVPFASLPVAVVAPPPAKTPWGVGAGERVPGLFVRKDDNSPTAMVSGSRLLLDQNSGKGFRRVLEEPETDTTRDFCMSEGERSFGEPTPPPTWGHTANPMLGLFGRDGREHVVAVHMEHVVDETPSSAALEIVDAWVDVSTRGARLIRRSKVPLARVATAPGDIHVYAARDEKEVHFVIVEPRRTVRSWSGIFQVGAEMSQSGCRHARSSLPIERGGAEATTFIVNTEVVTNDAPVIPGGGALGADMKAESVRSRPLRVHASVSWAGADAAPVLAVSMGWEARDRTSTAFRPVKAPTTKR